MRVLIGWNLALATRAANIHGISSNCQRLVVSYMRVIQCPNTYLNQRGAPDPLGTLDHGREYQPSDRWGHQALII